MAKTLTEQDCEFHKIDPCRVYGVAFDNGVGDYVLMYEGVKEDHRPSYMSLENAQHAYENFNGDRDPIVRVLVDIGLYSPAKPCIVPLPATA